MLLESSSPPPLSISDNGWLVPAIKLASPNFGPRPDVSNISLLVVHNISLPPGQFGGAYIESFFLNKLNASEHAYFETISELRVSAHCLIARDGRVTQFVSFFDRAWHAGVSSYQGVEDCNDYSVGIELEGEDNTSYTDQQYQALALVSQLLIKKYPLMSLDRIVGHCDIAPGRKTDPGTAFDWPRYFALLGVEPCT